MKEIINFIIIIVIIIIIFYNSIQNDFAFDDHLAIVNNKDTDPNTSFLNLWGNDIWGKGLREHDSHRSYRPLLILTFKLLRTYFGLNAGKIRIVSVASHALNTILLYILGMKITGNFNLVFISTILFASHPVHVESVTAVVNIAEPISSIFLCLTYLSYLSSIEFTTNLLSLPNSSSNSSTLTIKSHSIIYHFFMTISFFICLTCSVLYKETAITIVGIIVGTSIFIIFFHYCSLNSNKSPNFSILLHIYWLSLCGFSLLSYFLFRKLLVVSPEELSLYCSLIPSSLYPYFNIFCPNNLITTSSSSTSLRQRFSFSTIFKLFYETFQMLLSLFSAPLLNLSTVLLSINQNNNSTNSTITNILLSLTSQSSSSSSSSQYASFYLDQSQLIRRAENPFAFLNTTSEKIYSFSYLHFRYMYLLVYPQDLSAEYAYNCIPKVSTWYDDGYYRVTYAIIMYSILFFIGIIGLYSVWKHIRYQQSSLNKLKLNSNTNTDTNSLQLYLSSVYPLGILISLMFLVIPFIPASGIFLRLGTLLAERLLYVPSIGYCFLFSFFILFISQFLSLIVSRFITISPSNFQRITLFISILITLPIIIFFSFRTISRNLDWKDDTTLFFSSYKICPESAKLNLQIAKIYLNQQNFTAAEYHINHAIKIDPEFCDASHQQALLSLVYYRDIDKAIDYLVDGLKCIYTLSSSWQLLSQLWEERMRSSPKDYNIVSEIGDRCFEAGLSMMALRQYQQAVSLAYDQQKYTSALRNSIKAEKALKKLFKELMKYPSDKKLTGLPDVTQLERKPLEDEKNVKNIKSSDQVISWETYRELECNTYSLGGVLRYQMYEEYQQKKTKSKDYSQSILTEISRFQTLFLMGIRPVCIFDTTDPIDQKILIPHKVSFPPYPFILLQTYTHYLSLRYQDNHQKYQKYLQLKNKNENDINNDNELLENRSIILYDLAVFTDYASKAYGQFYHIKSRELSNPAESFSIIVSEDDPVTGELFGFYKQMKESLQTSLKFYQDAGEFYFNMNQFKKSEHCFERLFEIFTDDLVKTWGDDMKSISIPCNAYYWYSHSLVIQDGFFDRKKDIDKALTLLQQTIDCPITSSTISSGRIEDKNIVLEMKKYAKEQLLELKNYLKIIQSNS